jgi:hypothetical protein
VIAELKKESVGYLAVSESSDPTQGWSGVVLPTAPTDPGMKLGVAQASTGDGVRRNCASSLFNCYSGASTVPDWLETMEDRFWPQPDESGGEEARLIPSALRLSRGDPVQDAPCGAGRVSLYRGSVVQSVVQSWCNHPS